MSESDQEDKKGFPGSILFILLSVILMFTLLQNFLSIRVANVAFSHQLEHLVNLDLVQPEESRKTAINDNLVTFSGKFRESKTDEGKARHEYLSLLNKNHQIVSDQERIDEELGDLKGRVVEAADLFLHLSGQQLPQGGLSVVGDVYDSYGKEYSIYVKSRSERKILSVPELKLALTDLSRRPTENDLSEFKQKLTTLVSQFRSPQLGVGNELMKQRIRALDDELAKVDASEETVRGQLTAYGSALEDLEGVLRKLGRVDDHVRMNELRSVRSYKNRLLDLELLQNDLSENSLLLERARDKVDDVVWFFSDQELSTRSLEKQDDELFLRWYSVAEDEWEAFESNKGGVFKAPDQSLNLVLQRKFKSEEPPPNYFNLLIMILPVLLVLVVMYFIFSRQMKGMGNNAMNFGKSPARMLQQGDAKVTFKDVAGLDEAIEELYEIVEFLKDPDRFTALGGKIPKGVLCVGPPGTGKTLIARAVAGEANRPFFSISGSDFVEMFVGVGASRIRDMFTQAKKHAPCIVFIDEIDAVGRHRGSGIGGGHDEREQTLNQLLVEMDGFEGNEGIILMAATNRPDVLDKALLRPGRFDRRVVIGLPDIKGRYDILKVHARKVKMDSSVDLNQLARSTPGASGADLANMLNESALLAARKGRTAITGIEIAEARDKVLFGKERRSLEMTEHEKKTTAYHESGHAIVGLVVDHSDPVEKVTIIPRGQSLGATHFLPERNQLSYWKKELKDRLAVLMGGRAAEELFLGDFSSGAQQDLRQATQLARSMVCQWGMSDVLGLVAYDDHSDSGQYLGMAGANEKNYSDETARLIDTEVRRILDEAYIYATDLLERHREQVELMTSMLMEFETLDAKDCDLIIEGKWDVEEKRRRIKEQEELHKKPSALPPPVQEKSQPSTDTTGKADLQPDLGT